MAKKKGTKKAGPKRKSFFTSQKGVYSAQQQRFVAEYMVDCIGTQAAIRAGYNPKSASGTANRLLKMPHIQDAINIAKTARAERTEAKADEVLRELMRVGFADLRNVMEWGDGHVRFKESSMLPEQYSAAIAEVAVVATPHGRSMKMKLHGKNDALRMIGQHLRMFPTSIEGPGGGPIPLTMDHKNVATYSDEQLIAIIAKLTAAVAADSTSSEPGTVPKAPSKKKHT